MRINLISYEKVFPIAQYQNEKIGVQIGVDEGEDAHEVLTKARDMVEQFHKEKYPHLYEESQIRVVHAMPYKQLEPLIIADPNPKKKPSTEETVKEQIQQCSTIKTLQAFELLTRKNPDLKAAYEERLEQLQSAPL